MADEVFDGFDHTQYEQEVTERWGRDAYVKSDQWWRSLTDAQKKEFQQRQVDIAKDYAQANIDGKPADGPEAQAITQRHYEWLTLTSSVGKSHFIGLGQMYVDDPRFTANYDVHGTGTAEYIRDAMKVYGERNLSD